jgi:hypothetical protein
MIKFITKCLATKLSKVLPSLINKNQTCIPGRTISDNINTILDVVTVANRKNLKAAILMLNQEKAFDRLKLKF